MPEYSAGTIFLQVSPVFRDLQREIKREVDGIQKTLGDNMEKSGREAGKRAARGMNEELRKGNSEFERNFQASVENINDTLAKINTNRLGNALRKEIADIKRELKGLKDVDITADADFKRVFTQVDALEARLRIIRDDVKIVFKGDIDNVLSGIAKVKAAKEAIDPTIVMEVDTRQAERAVGSFEKSIKASMSRAAKHIDGTVHKEVRRLRDELEYLGKLRVGVDISGNQLRREVAEISAELDALASKEVDIDAKFDTGKAFVELATFEAALERVDGQDVEIDVKVNSRGAVSELNSARIASDDAANTFRSFNIIILALASLGPALIPALGGIAAALFALGPAAAVAVAALGSVLVGFSGIGAALKALGAQDTQAALTAQTAARSQAASARAVADARRSAARTIKAALESQRDAQERYKDSVDDVREAEQALKDARDSAKDSGVDLARQIREVELALSQTSLDGFNATIDYNATLADGSSTDAEREQARINLEQLRLRMEELRAEQKRLAAEKAEFDKTGVNGTEEVKSAQENLNEAIEAQADAYDDLKDAAQRADQARADGARQVREALQAQSEALSSVNTQQNAVDEAFGKMGSSGQRFALFLFSLRDGFYAFRDDIQSVLLPSIEEAIEGFLGSKSGSVARQALINLAESFGEFAIALSTSFQGAAWEGFFQMLADLGPEIQKAFGQAFIKFLEAMASIMTAVAPYALDLALGFERIMTAFADWAASREGQQGMQDFLQWAKDNGSDVREFFDNLVDAFVKVAIALAPWGMTVLNVLSGFLDIISKMDPNVLGVLLSAIAIMLTTAQIAYAIGSLSLALGALSALGGTFGLWILAIGLLIGLFLVLYQNNEEFRDLVKDAWKTIRESIMVAWNDWIKPALLELKDALMELWEDVIVPFLVWLKPALMFLAKHTFPFLAFVFSRMVGSITIAVRILTAILKIAGAAFKFLWREAVKPVLRWIGDAWGGLMDAMELVWENVLQPVFGYIAGELDDLQNAFAVAVDAIGEIWRNLRNIVSAPIRFILERIINDGLIAGINRVAAWVGMDGFDEIPIPGFLTQQYASGGIMPGYTPGRDTHTFLSPTGGRLDLSGGESVMRPEWTQAVGPGYVNQMNAAARSGGVKGIRKAMGYWMGGVLPLPGGSVARHASGYSGYAADMNWGSGYQDYGRAIQAYKAGVLAQKNYVGDTSYGRWAVVNHGGGQSSLYAHMSRFADIAVGQAVRAGQTLGYVGDIGNTGTPATSHLHFEVNGGSVGYQDTDSGGGRSIPSWLLGTIKDPLAAVKGWIVDPMKRAGNGIADTPLFKMMSKTPLLLAEKVTDKIWDIIPGWVKTGAGWAGDAAEWAVGGVSNALGAAADVAQGVGGGVKDGVSAVGDFLGFAEGGILPYNGTMKYDAGGMLPPGLTTVVNMTGKPEPVFTSDQWDQMGDTGSGDRVHYEPHFEGSNLTPEDVAADLNFTFRRISRGGKYVGVGK